MRKDSQIPALSKPCPVGYVVGVFDLLHEGHRNLLRRCAAMCEKLVVAVHTDAFTASYKTQPRQDERTRQRALQLSGLLPEGSPVLIIDSNHEPVWREYGVTHVLHGDDWERESYIDQIGRAAVERCGVEIVLLPATRGISSSMVRDNTSYFDNKHLVVFDLDGTLVLGTHALPGAVELVEALRARGTHIKFITNDTGYTKVDKAERLRTAGVPITSVQELLTPLDSLVFHLQKNGFDRVFLAATPAVRAWLKNFGIEHEEHNPQLVVLCRDSTLDYNKLTRICQLVHSGVPYIASNGDSYYPTPNGPGLDLAGIIEMVTITTGGIRPLRIFGKPHPSILEAAARPHAVAPAHVLMVGDRLNTDIQVAARFGCDSVLVLTGDTTREKLLTSKVRPTFVAEGVHILHEQLKKHTRPLPSVLTPGASSITVRPWIGR